MYPMLIRKSEWFLLAMVVAAFALGAWIYPQMPSLVASHWDAAGNVNGFMPRFWGVFLFPIIFFAIATLFFMAPRIDPRKDNIARFRKYFDYFIIGFGVFFLYIYALTLAWDVGYRFDFVLAIMPPLAGMIWLLGALLPHTELNFTIGIRTPWTISSETVWKKTHRAGGIAFRMCAVIALVGILFRPFELWFFIAPIVVAALGLVVYSYVLYRGEKK
jgi:uncharacterized membrane protein